MGRPRGSDQGETLNFSKVSTIDGAMGKTPDLKAGYLALDRDAPRHVFKLNGANDMSGRHVRNVNFISQANIWWWEISCNSSKTAYFGAILVRLGLHFGRRAMFLTYVILVLKHVLFRPSRRWSLVSSRSPIPLFHLKMCVFPYVMTIIVFGKKCYTHKTSPAPDLISESYHISQDQQPKTKERGMCLYSSH